MVMASPYCAQVACLDGFAPASIDDLCTIHARNYVLGLEQLIARKGAEIVDSSPTYVTPTSFQDALKVRMQCPLCPVVVLARRHGSTAMLACLMSAFCKAAGTACGCQVLHATGGAVLRMMSEGGL